jgi:membrane protease YdiL (CAAX protease family)
LSDRAFAPLLLFTGTYIALVAAVWGIAAPGSIEAAQWAALGSAAVATLVAPLASDRRLPRLGIFTRRWPRDLLAGLLLSVAAVGCAHALILATTSFRHRAGEGLSPGEIFLVFLPAVVHEELLFRGYGFQALARWNGGAAVAISAGVFALLHLGNEGIGAIGLLNIFLAGILLALAVLRWRSLLVAIAAHLGWNVLSGPVLGHEVSGWIPEGRLLESIDRGPALLTGGAFGIEGSVLMTLVETALIVALARGLPRAPAASMSPSQRES